MVQIKTSLTAFLGLTLATCTPLAQRSVATVLADLASIGTDITTLTTAVQAYTGGLTGALTIATDESALDTAVNQATTDVTAAGSFSVADSSSVVAAIAELTPQITSGLSALTAQESNFAASGLSSLVQSLLQTLQADQDKLGTAIQANAQAGDVPTLQSLQALIDAAFASTIAAF